MTATPPGDGWSAPGSCQICHAAPGRPHEDFCPVPAQQWEAEYDAALRQSARRTYALVLLLTVAAIAVAVVAVWQ